jgi:hypothetical protein
VLFPLSGNIPLTRHIEMVLLKTSRIGRVLSPL